MASPDTALWEQILSDPADLGPRAILGDLWIERDDADRGRFVARQVALERGGPHAPGYPAAYADAERILARYRQAWTAELKHQVDPEGELGKVLFYDLRFRGGLPHHVDVEHHVLQRVGAELVRAAPITSATTHRLALGGGGFRHLRRVTVRGTTVGNLARLAEEDLDHLEGFALQEVSIGAARMRGLLERLDRAALVAFGLQGATPGRSGMRSLFAAPWMAHLASLRLRACRLVVADLQPLVADSLFPMSSTRAPALRSLDIGGHPSFAGELGPLLARLSGQLEDLDVRGSYAAADVPGILAALAPEPHRLCLTTARGPLDAATLAAIGATPVARLAIGNAKLGPVGMAALCGAGLPAVTELVVRSNGIENDGVDALIAADPARLVGLDLSSNRLTDRAVVGLAAWPGLRHVVRLDLGNNPRIGDEGARALVASPWLRPAELHVFRGRMTEDAIDSLRERFGEALRLR